MNLHVVCIVTSDGIEFRFSFFVETDPDALEILPTLESLDYSMFEKQQPV